MNDEIDPLKGHLHLAKQTGCRHWASLFGEAVDDRSEPRKAPVTMAQGDQTVEPVDPDSG